ncbi:MAG TPA: hypothetical protein VGE12_04780 [Noviherbaspirillum sp.]
MDAHPSRKLLAVFVAVGVFIAPISECRAQEFENIKGWDYKLVYYAPKSMGQVANAEINGEVGHELWVSGPRAHCSAGSWQGKFTIVSGEFPPGITIDPTTLEISGVPTERGHWIVALKDDPLYCGGASFFGFQQKIFFHIGGSGKVIQ